MTERAVTTNFTNFSVTGERVNREWHEWREFWGHTKLIILLSFWASFAGLECAAEKLYEIIYESLASERPARALAASLSGTAIR